MNSDFSKIEKSMEECINYNFGNNLNVDGKSKKSGGRSKSKVAKLNGQVIILHTNWSKYTEIYPWLHVDNNNPNCRFCEQAIKDCEDMIETPWTKVGDSLNVTDSLLDEGKILKAHSKSENHEIAYQFLVDSGLMNRKDNLEKENKSAKTISDLPGFMPLTEWEELIKNFPWLYFKQNSFRCSICEEGFEKQRKAMFPTQWTCPDRMSQLGNPAHKSLRTFARFEKHQLTINHIKAIEIIKDDSDHSNRTELESKPVEDTPCKPKDESRSITSTKKSMIFSAPNVTTRTAIRKSLCDRNSAPDFLDEKSWLAYKQEFPWIYCSKNQFRCSYCEDAYKTHSTALVPTCWTCPDESENRNVVEFRRNQSKVRLSQHEQSKNHESAAHLLQGPVKPIRRSRARKSEPVKPEDSQKETVEQPVEPEAPLAAVPEPSPTEELISKPIVPVVPRQSRKSAPMKLVSLSYDEKPEASSSDPGEPRKSLKKAPTTVANAITANTKVESSSTPELSEDEIASIPAFLSRSQYNNIKMRYPWFFCRVAVNGYGCRTCETAIRMHPESMSKSRLTTNGGMELVDPDISYFLFRKRVYRHSESRNHCSAVGIVSCDSSKLVPTVAAAVGSADSRFTRLKTGSKSKIDYKRMSEGLLPCNDDSDEPHEQVAPATSVAKIPAITNATPTVGSLPKRRRQSSTATVATVSVATPTATATSSWLCPQCRSQFSGIDGLIRHIALCDYQPPCESSRALACPCNPAVFRFNTITKLDLHAAQEHDTHPLFHCYICSDRFKRISPLYHHMLGQHLINWDPFEAYFPVEPSAPVCCVVCSTEHSSEIELTRHYLQVGRCRDQLQSARVVLEDILAVPECLPSSLLVTVPAAPPVVEEVTILDVEELSEEKEAVIYSPLKKNRNQHNRIHRNHPLRRFGPPSTTKPDIIDKIKRSKEITKPATSDILALGNDSEPDRSIEHKSAPLLPVTESVSAEDSNIDISTGQSGVGLEITESKIENNNNNVDKININTESVESLISTATESVKIDQPIKPNPEESDQSVKPIDEKIDNSIKPITEKIDQSQVIDEIDQKEIKPITNEINQLNKPIIEEIDQSVNLITDEINQSMKPISEKIDSHSNQANETTSQPIDSIDQSKPSVEQSTNPHIDPVKEIESTDKIKSVDESINTVDESINTVVESLKSIKSPIVSKKSMKTPDESSSRRSVYNSRKSSSASPSKAKDDGKARISTPIKTDSTPIGGPLIVNSSGIIDKPPATLANNNQSQIELQIDQPVVKKRRHRRTKKMIQMDEERRLAELGLNPTGPVRRKSSSSSSSRPKRARLDKSRSEKSKAEVIDIVTQVVDLNEIMRETEIKKKHPVQIKTGIPVTLVTDSSSQYGDQAQSVRFLARPLKKQPIKIQSQLSPCKKLKAVPVPVPVPTDEDIPIGLSFMERMKKIRQLKKNRTELQREQMMAVDQKIAEINERSRSTGSGHSTALFVKSDRIRKLLSSEQYSMHDLKSIITHESSKKESKRRATETVATLPPGSSVKQHKHEQQEKQHSASMSTAAISSPPPPQSSPQLSHQLPLSPRQVSSAPQTPTSALSGSVPKPNSTTSLPIATSSATVSDYFSCEVCQVGFKSLRARDNHATTEHKGLRLFCCRVCDLSFTTHILLRKHAQKYHIDNVSLAVFGKEHSSNDASFSFQCSFCPLQFTSRSGLNHHVTSGHRPDGDCVIDEFVNKLILADSSSSPQACCICQETMDNQFELEIHMIEHQKESQALENVPTQFACPKCCRLFFGRDGKSYLKDHYNIIHLEKQPPSCEECETKFTSTICYSLHRKSVKNCSKKTADQLKIDDPYGKLNDPSKLAFVCSRCQTLVAGESAETRFARHQVDCNSDSYAIENAISPGVAAVTAADSAVNSSMSDDLLVTTNASPPDSLAAEQT